MGNEEKLLGYLRRVTSDLRVANRRLRELEAGDPVAVVGIGCRFPGGAGDAEGLWELVRSGTDAVGEFPGDRGWVADGGAGYARAGGFVAGAAEFDAEFFGISPREAAGMDPQQRVLLEVCWEAVERAGISAQSLRGSRTGVFTGTNRQDYADVLAAAGEPAGIGVAACLLSGRASYVLGLEGPAVTVDTACSSSLVTLHLAAQALRSGECDLALAGGVTVMSTPGAFGEFAAQGGLSGDGRCKAFSADADGTGWGEGAGMLVLERLPDADRNGHPVLALIAGSAVNSDGASNGLTAPNGPSQQRVIWAALAAAGIGAGAVDAVEAHGTGTVLGDPIEAQALIATYGQDRDPARPLWLGSVKSNIGHTQAAAGVAGVIKMIMALRHQVLPPTLHAARPSPHIDWSARTVQLLTAPVPWPAAPGRPRRAAISSFGVSGTNAHVILQEPPAPQPAPDPGPDTTTDSTLATAGTTTPVPPGLAAAGTVPWVLSARTSHALRAQARQLRHWSTAHPQHTPADIGWSLATGRAMLEDRAVVLGEAPAGLAAGLAAMAAEEPSGSVVTGRVPDGGAGKTVFVFPGQGGQWAQMAAGLTRTCPPFAARLAECAAALAPHVDWPAAQTLAGPGADALDRPDVVQPVLWAVMVALAAAWESIGVTPDAVAGHSQGEIAAATVAGILSLADAARIVAVRSKALARLPAGGAMAAVAWPAETARQQAAGSGGQVWVAAVNSPDSVVLAGNRDSLAEILDRATAAGARTRWLPVSYASHGPAVAAVAGDLAADLAGISPAAGQVPFWSAVTGLLADGAGLDAAYWVRNLCEQVRFEDVVRGLAGSGHGAFVEMSPHPVLVTAIEQTLAQSGCPDAVVAGTLRRDDGGPRRLLASAAELFTRGVTVDWARVFDGSGARRADLPTYPFQRQRYWPAAAAWDVSGAGLISAAHPLLGAALVLAGEDGVVFTGRLPAAGADWLADHMVAGLVLVPGTALVELAAWTGGLAACPRVQELTLETPLILPAGINVQVQVRLSGPQPDGSRSVTLYSLAGGPQADQDTGEWTRHASGTVTADEPGQAELDIAAAQAELAGQWPPPGAEPVPVAGEYDRMAESGFCYGPAFRGLVAAWRRGADIFAEARLPEDQHAGAAGYLVHPALLDAVLHAVGLISAPGWRLGPEDAPGLLPFGWDGVRLAGRGARALRARLRPAGDGAVTVLAVDEAGQVALAASRLALRPPPPGGLRIGQQDALFTVEWVPVTGTATSGGSWAVLGADAAAAAGLTAAGITAVPYPDLAALTAAAADGQPVPPVVAVRLDGLIPELAGLESAAAVRRAVQAVLALVQDWLTGPQFAESALVLVSTRAVATALGEPLTSLAGAAAAGLARSAQSENPGQLLLADLDGLQASWQALAGAAGWGEPELAIREGRVLGRRIARAPAPGLDHRMRPDPVGTALVTGASGLLAGLVARLLAARCAASNLALVSRRGPAAPGVARLASALAEAGARVQLVACDVSDRQALAAVLGHIPAEHPLTTVIHAAGALDDGVVGALTPDRVDYVLRPKAAAIALDELTAAAKLSAFVLFSSAAATFGAAGQGNYAAANAVLDALAQQRRARGQPATSVAWGLWEQASGMTAHLSTAERERASGAAGPLSTGQGLDLFETALAVNLPTAVATNLDLAGLRAQGRAGTLLPLWHTLIRVRASQQSAVPAVAGLRRQLAGLTEPAQQQLVLDLVRRQAADVLGHASAEPVRPGAVFRELGFDSLTAVELRNRLATATGLRLPATMVFDHPTPQVLASWLHPRLAGLSAPAVPVAVTEPAAGEPVAVVGMGCRFPAGAATPEDLWQLVRSGTDAVSAFPADRGWPADGGYARVGGFVAGAAEFDAEFFGISPREALAMDPQQRLLLEVSWEAIERAGISPPSLRGSRTGVFAGVSTHDYGSVLAWAAEDIGGHANAGNAGSVASGRVSYVLGLEGPAVTVDTACSSALVALHLAGQALRAGECDLALAGGVTIMATPEAFGEFARQGALAGDGRCKAFGAGADGTGWGEGAGVLLVERLSDARRLGHPVLAVVAGSAVNSDGASNGLTAPNGPSQQRVIRAALAAAGVTAAQVDLVEAHGTGTVLGDPIEAQALIATYGQDRDPARPLWLGSVKSNIGHTQAAAGVAGVIKAVMALRHQLLPPTLHASEPSPHVDWSAGTVRLLTAAQDWPDTGRPRLAAVSSFSMSGTNAHVILESAGAQALTDTTAQAPLAGSPGGAGRAGALAISGGSLAAIAPSGETPWVISGRSAAALAAQADRLRVWAAAQPAPRLADAGWSLATGRSFFSERAVVLAHDLPGFGTGLGAVAAGEPVTGVVTGRVPDGGPGKVVFVFPGQGGQWPGMTAALAASCPAFADRLAQCAAALAPQVDWPVSEVLAATDETLLDRADIVQPVLWAVMVALAAAWESIGVVPDAVAGHSQGEIAAATVAGILPLAEAARIVAVRSKALARLPEGGAMAAVAWPAGTALGRLAGSAGRAWLAAVNSPSSVVLAGDRAALGDVLAQAEAEGVRTRWLPVSYASHGPGVDQVAGPLADELAGVSPAGGLVPFWSAVTAQLTDGTSLDGAYWVSNLREQVRFEQVVRGLADCGHGVFVEVSPHPVLVPAMAETLGPDGGVVAGTLRRDEGGSGRLLASAAEIFTRGASVDWAAVFAGRGARQIDVPTYAFQRRRFWPSPRPATDLPVAGGDGAEAGFWAAVEQQDLAGVAGAMGARQAGLAGLAPVLPVLAAWRRRRRAGWLADRWLYQVGWQPVAGAEDGVLTGRWLLVVPAGLAAGSLAADGLPAACAAALAAGQAEVMTVTADAAGLGRAALADVLRRTAGIGQFAGVLSLLALDETGPRACPAGLAGTLVLLQALGDAGISAGLWVLTCGATGAGAAGPIRAGQAMAWGLGRVAALEYPDRYSGLIDVPAVLCGRAAGWLRAVLAGQTGEDQVAVTATGLLARRLTRLPAGRAGGRWIPASPVLITGGTGAAGGQVARWLAGRGAPGVVLTSRRGLAASGAAALAARLSGAGTAVTVAACDVADRADLAALWRRQAGAGAPVRAVVHAAGVLDDGVIDALSPARMAGVAAVKAATAQWLDELAGDQAETFVMFSSVASAVGSAGQGNYAAANAALDAIARDRRGRGLAAVTVAWGVWAGGGLVTGEVAARAARGGLLAMPPRAAAAALGRVLDLDAAGTAAARTAGGAAVLIADVDWARYAPAITASRPSPLLSGVPEAARVLAAIAVARPELAEGRGLLAGRLAATTAAEQQQLVLDVVCDQAASVLGHDSAAAVRPGAVFRDLGFDSLTAVEFRNRLVTVTGLALPATLVFDYPTPLVLARWLLGEITGAVVTADVPRPAVAPALAAAVAVVGIGCRFPGGVAGPQELWQLVRSGTDAMGGFPADRGWPEVDGADGFVPVGGFVPDAAGFDAGFFGISPREAVAMDPQQRLLLEVCWEAIERAGISPHALRGSRTGVFAGTNGQDYAALLAQAGEGEGHSLTGNATSVISGRISYAFGLEGPAVSVDTACSSSLVALHLACQSLRSGECDLTLAGGVTVMATPGVFGEFAAQGGLAGDGRCKAFGAGADGTGWGEGAGVLVLERLPDAERNRHPVLAVVAGSAVNQDGASNGLTAPNGPSQQRVIRAALASAGLGPADVDAVEAHGTGTSLGDPIEAQALIAAYGQHRDPDRPLWLGSVKSNIGHTQAAAGAAGLIKMIMAMRAGVLPPTLHADEPSPHIDWSDGTVRLLNQAQPWPDVSGRPRRAGVSSFGISGTNAHVILEHALPKDEEGAPAAPPARSRGAGSLGHGQLIPWPISGRSAAALAAQAGRLGAWAAASAGLNVADAGWSLAAGRAMFEDRAVILGTDVAGFTAGLGAVAAGSPAAGVVTGRVPDGGCGKVVFVFAGQGCQRAGMGRALAQAFPVFAEAAAEASRLLGALLGQDLTRIVFAGPGSAAAGAVDQTVFTQAALFAVQVGLARLLQSWGITPDYVTGHSIGELAAAHVAGVLSLADACTLVAARGQMMQQLGGGGAMAAITAAVTQIAPVLARVGGQVEVAAVNGPQSVVVSGTAAAVAATGRYWRNQGVRVRRLRVSHAFHSPLVEPMLTEFGAVAATVSYQRPRIPVVCSVTGQPDPELIATPGYWVRQAREAVRFADCVAWLAAAGATVFAELGGDGSLSAIGPASTAVDGAEGGGGAWLAVPRAGRPEPDTALAAAAEMFTRGVQVDWAAVTGQGRTVDLPTYAFQRQWYWPVTAAPDDGRRAAGGDGAEAGFWAAVARQDLAGLTGTLRLGGDEPFSAVLPALAAWRSRHQLRSVVDAWHYQVAWQPVTGVDDGAVDGQWLLVIPAGLAGAGLAAACEQVLTQGGAEVMTVAVATAELDRELLAVRLRQAAGDGSPAGVLSLLALTAGECAGAPAAVASSLLLVQALTDAGIGARLWSLTSGAVAAAADDQAVNVAQAMVWGLGRVAALEYPRQWGGLIDVHAAVTGRAAGWLRAVLAGRAGEDQVAIRGAGALGRRLVRVRAAAPGTRSWRPSGPVLITGGTGALGRQVAQWLARRGAAQVILVSRRGAAAAGAGALAARLCGRGTEVTVTACDVAERAELAALWTRLTRPGRTVRAVMHTAAVLDDGVVDALTPARLATVLRVKAAVAEHLDQLSAGTELDAFVLFSSIAGTVGAAGQANYAAANAGLDAIAERRRSQGLAATSVAWGVWGGEGMAGQAAVAARARRGGIVAMAPRLAAAALGPVLARHTATAVVADMDWARFTPGFISSRPSPLLTAIAEARQAIAAAEQGGPAQTGLAAQLAELPAARQEQLVLELVCQTAAAVLGHASAAAVRPGAVFRDLGFDSLTAVEFRNRLAGVTGVQLPATLAFDYPTPQLLARWLRPVVAPAAQDSIDPSAEEAEIRRALAEIPLARLRSVGLIEPLLRLAGQQGDEPAPTEQGEPESIDAMDAESLIRMARGNAEI